MGVKIVDSKILSQVQSQNGKAFCPCSGNDIEFVLNLFGSSIGRFVFCDLQYRPASISAKLLVPAGWKLLSSIFGKDTTQSPKKTWYSNGREFQPIAKIETWQRPQPTEVIIEFRKDLAQDFLVNSCKEDSISCFVHINDGEGEGGSNLWFLGVDKSVPGKGLLEEVSQRLTKTAVVVSDGAMAEKNFRDPYPFEMFNRSWEPIQTFKSRGERVITVWKTEKLL